MAILAGTYEGWKWYVVELNGVWTPTLVFPGDRPAGGMPIPLLEDTSPQREQAVKNAKSQIRRMAAALERQRECANIRSRETKQKTRAVRPFTRLRSA